MILHNAAHSHMMYILIKQIASIPLISIKGNTGSFLCLCFPSACWPVNQMWRKSCPGKSAPRRDKGEALHPSQDSPVASFSPFHRLCHESSPVTEQKIKAKVVYLFTAALIIYFLRQCRLKNAHIAFVYLLLQTYFSREKSGFSSCYCSATHVYTSSLLRTSKDLDTHRLHFYPTMIYRVQGGQLHNCLLKLIISRKRYTILLLS